MCDMGNTERENGDISQRLGERGDLIACLSSDVAAAVDGQEGVSPGQLKELRAAMAELDDLLDEVDVEGADVGVDEDKKAVRGD